MSLLSQSTCLTRQKRFIESNQAKLELLGYSREELLSMSIPDVDVDPAVVLPAHRQLLSGDRLVNYEHKLKRKNGDVITVLNNSRPISNDNGTVIGMQSTLINITDRKQVERSLRESQIQLAKSNQILAGVLEHTDVMTVLWIGNSISSGQPRLRKNLQPCAVLLSPPELLSPLS